MTMTPSFFPDPRNARAQALIDAQKAKRTGPCVQCGARGMTGFDRMCDPCRREAVLNMDKD